MKNKTYRDFIQITYNSVNRQLLLVCRSVLNMQRCSQNKANRQREDIASIGLKSACRIVLDMLEVDADEQA